MLARVLHAVLEVIDQLFKRAPVNEDRPSHYQAPERPQQPPPLDLPPGH